jgi:hypothetical protein
VVKRKIDHSFEKEQTKRALRVDLIKYGVSTSQKSKSERYLRTPSLLCDEIVSCFYRISSDVKVTVFHSDISTISFIFDSERRC